MNKLVFTDVDGTKYFKNERGDIVDAANRLVPLHVEHNVRLEMNSAIRNSRGEVVGGRYLSIRPSKVKL